MYRIEFSERALQDLQDFKKSDQALLVDSIEKQLLWEPTNRTRNRKPLRPNELSKWELRIKNYRVFYDVKFEGDVVTVKAIGFKRGNRLFISGKEFRL